MVDIRKVKEDVTMRLVICLIALVCFPSAALAAGNDDVVGEWGCEAVVDMTYPFNLELSEVDGKLTGKTSSTQGSLDLSAASFQEGVLKFRIESPEVGPIDFQAKPNESGLAGSLAGTSFDGSFSCKRK